MHSTLSRNQPWVMKGATMSTGQANRFQYALSHQSVASKMYCLVVTHVFPDGGELRSLPAEISQTGEGVRSKPAKEHPAEPSSSAVPLEPAQEPVLASTLGPESPI